MAAIRPVASLRRERPDRRDVAREVPPSAAVGSAGPSTAKGSSAAGETPIAPACAGAVGGPPAAPPPRLGNVAPASFQSGQPSRHTSESAVIRPWAIHSRKVWGLAGPYWPPLGGRTYQFASGASASGSAIAGRTI